VQIQLKRGEVLELVGMYDEAEKDYRAALDSAKDDIVLKADAQYALGKLNRLRGEFEPALDWLGQAKAARTTMEDRTGLAQVLIQTGMVLYRKGDHNLARKSLNEGLAFAREAGKNLYMAWAFNNLGNVALSQSDYATAQALYQEGLLLFREMSDKAGISSSLNNLGNVAFRQGDFNAARTFYEKSLVLDHEMGDKSGISIELNNLGNVAQAQGNYSAAQALLEDCLALKREMGEKWGIAMSLDNLGLVALARGDHSAARTLHEESLAFKREMGEKWGIAKSLNNLGYGAMAQDDNAAARTFFEESLVLCKEMDDKSSEADALLGLGLVELARDKPKSRENILHSLRLRQETGEQYSLTASLIGVAGLVLHEGKPQFAAQLLGAVESALKGLNAVMEVEVKFFHEGTLVAAREQLGESTFHSAWEQGATWSLEEAVKKVLDTQ